MSRRISARAHAAVERELRVRPRLEPVPSGLHERIMAAVAEREQERPARVWVSVRWGALAAACVALMTGVGFVLMSRPPAPPATGGGPSGGEASLTSAVDPTPMLLPAAQFFASSDPLASEAKSVIEDTRRAADFVVSCLPFARGG